MTAPGASARRKGIRFEQELARHFGTVTTRSTRPGVHEDPGDVVLDDWVVEAKNHKRWSVALWFADVEVKADLYGLRPVLILSRPQRTMADSLVVVRLRDVTE